MLKKIAFRNNQDKYALHISRSSWSRNKSIPNQQEEHTSIQQQQKQEPRRTLTPGSSFCRWRPQRWGGGIVRDRWSWRPAAASSGGRGIYFIHLHLIHDTIFLFSYIITLCVSLLMYKLYAHGLFTVETLCTITL